MLFGVPKIKWKRGLFRNLPQLDEAEPAITTDTKQVFVGTKDGNVELAKKEIVESVQADLESKISQVDNKTVGAITKAQDVENQFNRVVAEAGSNNPEVVQARGNEVNLNSRLNKVDASLADISYFVTPQMFGAKGDGVTDDTVPIQNAVNAGVGKTIIFPQTTKGYFITNTITVPNSARGTKLVYVGGGRAGDNIIHIDSSFPAGKPVFELADGTIIDNITINNLSSNPNGIGFSMFNNTKWCTLNNVSILGMDKGIRYGNGSYYNEINNPKIQYCNTALEVDGNGGVCGSLLVNGGQFSNNKDKGLFMKYNGNDIKLNGVTMEYNKTNHVYSLSGAVSLQKCYLADGAYTPIYVNGGKVVIDGDDTEYVGGGGAGLPLDVNVPTYGIKADSGEVILKNLLLTKNIYANTGIIGGQYYRGFDLYSSNAKITTRNVKASDYRQVKLDKNINNNLERVDNYIINGEFHDVKRLPFDIKIDGFATVDTSQENGYGGKILKLSNGTSLCQITGRFFAPDLVGKIAYIGIEIADSVGQNAPRFNATNTTPITDGSVPKLSDASYQAGGQFAGWQISGGLSGYPICHWLPCIVDKPYGDLKYYLNWNGSGASLTVHRIFMVDADNFQKVATFKSMNVPRYGTVAPIGGTWEVGERIVNITPAVGQPKSWVCTVAGTPGTWVSEGNL